MSKGTVIHANGRITSSDVPQHVPAWKQLGLKLKFAKDTADQPRPSAVNETSHKHASSHIVPSQALAIEEPFPIRSTDLVPSAKRRRTQASPTSGPTSDLPKSPALRREPSTHNKKKVAFTAGTKEEDGDTAISVIPSDYTIPAPKPNSSTTEAVAPTKIVKKEKKSKHTQPSKKKLHSALQYLTEYQESRETWKFNKNRETWLLKHLHSIDDIPASYDAALGLYLRGLRGESAKTRIVEKARKELSHVGGELPPESNDTNAAESMEDPELQDAYQRDAKERYRRKYEEYLEKTETTEELDPKCYRQFAKRRRAEIVLWSMDVEPGSTPSTTSTTTELATKTNGHASLDKESHSQPSPQAMNGIRKKRKNRTALVELSSSSSSSSSDDRSDDDSDSDSNTRGGSTLDRSSSNTISRPTTSSEISSDKESTSNSGSDSSSSSESETSEVSSSLPSRRARSVITISSARSKPSSASKSEISDSSGSDSGTSSLGDDGSDAEGESDSD